jgi:hypothetical protein
MADITDYGVTDGYNIIDVTGISSVGSKQLISDFTPPLYIRLVWIPLMAVYGGNLFIATEEYVEGYPAELIKLVLPYKKNDVATTIKSFGDLYQAMWMGTVRTGEVTKFIMVAVTLKADVNGNQSGWPVIIELDADGNYIKHYLFAADPTGHNPATQPTWRTRKKYRCCRLDEENILVADTGAGNPAQYPALSNIYKVNLLTGSVELFITLPVTNKSTYDLWYNPLFPENNVFIAIRDPYYQDRAAQYFAYRPDKTFVASYDTFSIKSIASSNLITHKDKTHYYIGVMWAINISDNSSVYFVSNEFGEPYHPNAGLPYIPIKVIMQGDGIALALLRQNSSDIYAPPSYDFMSYRCPGYFAEFGGDWFTIEQSISAPYDYKFGWQHLLYARDGKIWYRRAIEGTQSWIAPVQLSAGAVANSPCLNIEKDGALIAIWEVDGVIQRKASTDYGATWR